MPQNKQGNKDVHANDVGMSSVSIRTCSFVGHLCVKDRKMESSDAALKGCYAVKQAASDSVSDPECRCNIQVKGILLFSSLVRSVIAND